MRPIDFDKSVKSGKVVQKKNIFAALLDYGPIGMLSAVILPYFFGIIYSVITNQVPISFIVHALLAGTFYAWLLLGQLNKGKLLLVEGCTEKQAIECITSLINSASSKRYINGANENYMAIEQAGWSIGAYSNGLYFLFHKDQIYISSCAIGIGNDFSSFHYFSNQRTSRKLKKLIIDTQQTA